MKPFSGLIIFVLSLIFFTQCTPESKTAIAFVGETQGTYYRVTYYAEDTLVTQQEVEQMLNRFDSSVSVYNPHSLITRLNNSRRPVKGDAYFFRTWQVAQEVSAATAGAFDCTVGPLVEAWGFSFREKMPVSQPLVDSLRALVGFQHVMVEGDSVFFARQGMRLDFNAVAQGVSVDIVAELLASRGIENYLVDIGGEVLAAGYKPGNHPWRVGVEKPADNAAYGENLQAVVQLTGKALATSGSYRKFYIKDGVKYSHTIDPQTGYPVVHSLLSATVIANQCGVADAWATALMVLGSEKGKAVILQHNELEAYLIFINAEGKSETWASDGFLSVME
ncbi:MAG: FAD:protein FMN transferase [Bacteroidales bacterium]|nr:FAD:protein FMN transferase [Bacteroidales bacterium]MDD2322021.1 FAD:protein FMN transferase [Bacteroidales bacterium]MDD3009977.1 FAD:protein FMN transferase [Bacteroidales bacterium]MDD3960813.1 FAD:protein FMN transferase [Bacteroidales bacterium]MDY0284704.1 FAD:protein FMN transferase [Bacteroidales bacterium]